MICGRELEIIEPSARTISSTHAKNAQTRKTTNVAALSQTTMDGPRSWRSMWFSIETLMPPLL